MISPGVRQILLRGSGVHPIARARINAIFAAGGSCPVGQQTAMRLLSNFIREEEAAGRWALHRRIYIPGFGNAAANAIDLVAGLSGSFPVAGGVTHGLGFARGNGTTGFFDPGAGSEYGTLGLSAGSASIFCLAKTQDANVSRFHGIAGAGLERFSIGVIGNGQNSFVHPSVDAATAVQIADDIRTGVFVGSSTAANNRHFHRRTSAGVTNVSNTTLDTLVVPNLRPYFLARNANGVAAAFTTAEYGAYGFGLGLTLSQSEAFSANLRTLWQGLFQLSLP